jgi:hypothetical protein
MKRARAIIELLILPVCILHILILYVWKYTPRAIKKVIIFVYDLILLLIYLILILFLNLNKYTLDMCIWIGRKLNKITARIVYEIYRDDLK